MANHMVSRLAIVLGIFFVSACSGGESLETESATNAGGSSELFDALPEVPDGYGNDEYLKFGALVLVDDDGEAVPSGNPGADRFVVEVVALRERSGEVVFQLTFNNAEVPSMIGINWQCEGGDRIGLLRSNQDGRFSFSENGQPDTEAGFDLNAGPGCEGTIAPHPAGAQLFGDELLTVTSESQGVRFATEGGVSWLFEVRELGLAEVSTTITPPTTVKTDSVSATGDLPVLEVGDQSVAVLDFTVPECSNSAEVEAFGRTWHNIRMVPDQSWRYRVPLDGVLRITGVDVAMFEVDGESLEMIYALDIDAVCAEWADRATTSTSSPTPATSPLVSTTTG